MVYHWMYVLSNTKWNGSLRTLSFQIQLKNTKLSFLRQLGKKRRFWSHIGVNERNKPSRKIWYIKTWSVNSWNTMNFNLILSFSSVSTMLYFSSANVFVSNTIPPTCATLKINELWNAAEMLEDLISIKLFLVQQSWFIRYF